MKIILLTLKEKAVLRRIYLTYVLNTTLVTWLLTNRFNILLMAKRHASMPRGRIYGYKLENNNSHSDSSNHHWHYSGGDVMRVAKLAIACIALTGCATPSSVAPYGKDSYMVNVDDVWGANSPGSLQIKAAHVAGEYCRERGKEMIVRNSAGSGLAWVSGTSSSMVFSCVDTADPEYARPNLKKSADTVIEIRK